MIEEIEQKLDSIKQGDKLYLIYLLVMEHCSGTVSLSQATGEIINSSAFQKAWRTGTNAIALVKKIATSL